MKSIIIKGIKKEYKKTAPIKKIDRKLGKFIKNRIEEILHLKEMHQTFLALDNINFELEKGDILGIIGPNGSGKSTLLKLISRITYPTSGSIKLNGKLSTDLSIGTGFHPELTGIENIYLKGTIIGMTRKEIDSKIDDIINFSGLREFIDTPIKRYSSGMNTRLSFSISVFLDTDILIIDEGLSVGDKRFKKKSLEKLTEIWESGKTIIFVSHDLELISRLSNKILYLNKGKINKFGSNTKEIINLYKKDCLSENN